MERYSTDAPVIDMQVETGPPDIGGEAAGLNALRGLFNDLNSSGIPYCHWKSNLRLSHSLAGKTDLDLLVSEEERADFRALLHAHGLRRVLAPAGSRYPGLEDYLGVDGATGTIFHLHVHYQLVLGQQFVKNYILPFTEELIGHSMLRLGVRIPQPAFELVVLVMRALLKYRDRDGIKDLLDIRSPGIPDHIRSEILGLLDQTSPDAIEMVLEAFGEAAPADAVRGLLETMKTGPRDGRRLLALRMQVHQALRPYQRHTRLVAGMLYFRELWRRRDNFLRFTPKMKKTWPGTAPVIALIGADGSGKTSHTSDLTAWLDAWMEVRRLYFGSKEPSVASRLLYISFRAFRKGARDMARFVGGDSLIVKTLARVRQNLLYMHAVSIGLDRYRRYRLSLRLSRRGVTVLCDRFPLIGILDGPAIEELSADFSLDPFGKALRAIEERLYARMAPPPMIWLAVDPVVAENRKPDHDRSAIAAKVDLLEKIYRTQACRGRSLDLDQINANRPYDEVSTNLKRKIWSLAAAGRVAAELR